MRLKDLTNIENDKFYIRKRVGTHINSKQALWEAECKHCRRVNVMQSHILRNPKTKGCKKCQGGRGLSFEESLEIVRCFDKFTPNECKRIFKRSSSVIYTALRNIKILLEDPKTNVDVRLKILETIFKVFKRDQLERIKEVLQNDPGAIREFSYTRDRFKIKISSMECYIEAN